jgi:hypothetical protein
MSYNHSTYPQDYLEWCFGEASNISDYTKSAQIAQMYSVKAYQEQVAADFYSAREARDAPLMEYWACEYEPVPAHQVLTDRLTELLRA